MSMHVPTIKPSLNSLKNHVKAIRGNLTGINDSTRQYTLLYLSVYLRYLVSFSGIARRSVPALWAPSCLYLCTLIPAEKKPPRSPAVIATSSLRCIKTWSWPLTSVLRRIDTPIPGIASTLYLTNVCMPMKGIAFQKRDVVNNFGGMGLKMCNQSRWLVKELSGYSRPQTTETRKVK